MERKLWKKLTSVLMSVVLAAGLCPGLALADEGAALQSGSGTFIQANDAEKATYTLFAKNEEKMWKVAQVEVEDNPGSQQDYMTVYLTSKATSYKYCFAGTQDEAASSFDMSKEEPSSSLASRWSQPVEQKFDQAVTYGTWNDGSDSVTTAYGHRLPIAIPEGKTEFTVDVVCYAVSSKTLTARRIDVDLDSKTAVCGSAHDVAKVAVTSEVADVVVNPSASIDYTGYVAPYAGNQSTDTSTLSNDWASTLTLKLANASIYDQAYAVTYETKKTADYDTTLGNKVDPVKTDYATVDKEGTLALPVVNEYDTTPKTKQLNRDEITVMMHVATSAPYVEAGQWVERSLKLNFTSRTTATLAISGKALEEKAKSRAYDGNAVSFINNESATFGMFAAQEGTSCALRGTGKYLDITYVPKNTKTYTGFFLDSDIRQDPSVWAEHEEFLLKDGKFHIVLPADTYCGKSWPVAVVKADGSTTKTQYFLAIPAKEKLSVTPVTLADGLYELPALMSSSAKSAQMFNHMESDSRFLRVDGDTATIIFTQDGSTASVGKYSRLALGKSSTLIEKGKNYVQDADLNGSPTLIEGVKKTAVNGIDRWHFEIPLTKDAVTDMLNKGNVLYITVWNNTGSSADKIPGWYNASSDLWIEVNDIVGDKVEEADYTAVDAALNKIPQNESEYTEESWEALQDAVAAVVECKDKSHQSEVDAMASNINSAIDGLVTKAEAALDAAKVNASQELNKYADLGKYRDAQKQEIGNLLAKGEAAIQAATTESAVSAALAAAKAEIDKVKTDAQLTTEEKAAADKAAADKAAADKAAADKAAADKAAAEAAAKAAAEAAAKAAAEAAANAGLPVNEKATTGTGAAAAVVKATSATEVQYTAPAKKSAKSAIVPDTVTVNGKTFKVTSIAAKAFKGSKATSITIGKNVKTVGKNALKGSKAKKLTIKTSKFTKKAMKNLLKGSKVKTIKLKGVSKKVKKNYKKWAKAYGVTVK